MPTTFASDFKRFFFRGLAAVLPTVVTLAILFWVLGLVHRYAGRYINIAGAYVLAWVQTNLAHPTDYDAFLDKRSADVLAVWTEYFWWVGFLVAIIAIYMLGRFVGSYFGRYTWRVLEAGFFRLPVIKAVYPQVKQVTDFLLAERKIESSRVVAVEYPRKGIWSLGLVTCDGMRTLAEATGADLLTVFIPSSPTPVTGYTITVRRDETVELPISIDEALRFTISGGVIMPPSQVLAAVGASAGARELAAPDPVTKEIAS